MNIKIFSKGLYSSWCYYKPERILFDAGEGVATNLGNEIYGPEKIFISHSHMDHYAGLLSFIGCRDSARGDKKKFLEIFYPLGEKMENFIEYLKRTNNNLHFQLNYIPFSDENCILAELNENKWIEIFKSVHSYDSVNYKIIEKRKRLKKEYIGQNIKELKKSGLTNDQLSEEYFANLFTYGLDAFDYKKEDVENCEWLIADSTFLKKEDRDAPVHGSVEELIPFALENKIKRLTLAHFSSRYSQDEILQYVNKFIINNQISIEKCKIDVVTFDMVNEL